MEAIVLKVGVIPKLVVLLDTKSSLLQQQALFNITKFASRRMSPSPPQNPNC